MVILLVPRQQQDFINNLNYNYFVQMLDCMVINFEYHTIKLDYMVNLDYYIIALELLENVVLSQLADLNNQGPDC